MQRRTDRKSARGGRALLTGLVRCGRCGRTVRVFYGTKSGHAQRREGHSEREMGKLTGTRYGDAANALFAFYAEKAHELEEAGQDFMAAIGLAFALETGILTYLLVEFGEENGGELQIPDNGNMAACGDEWTILPSRTNR